MSDPMLATAPVDTELDKRIGVAHYVASTADSMIMDLFHKTFLNNQKDLVDGLVTDLDVVIADMCLKNIQSEFAGDGFRSVQKTTVSTSGYAWIVDPIAGTNNFLRGIPLCGFQLAILQGTKMIFSLIMRPFTQERFMAQSGKGATYQNRITGETANLRVSERSLPQAMGIFDASIGKMDNPATQILASLANEVAAVRAFGVAVFDIPAVASGCAEFFVTGISDRFYVAAGALLLAEAGGEVYNLDGELPGLDDSFMIFSSKSLKEPLLRAIKSAL